MNGELVMSQKTKNSVGSPLFVLTYQDLRNSYIKKLFLDFGQGAKLDLLVINLQIEYVGCIQGTFLL